MQLIDTNFSIEVDLDRGCDISLLAVKSGNDKNSGNLLSGRGLQTWIKKGTVLDPNTGGLSNYFGNSRNLAYSVKESDKHYLVAEAQYREHLLNRNIRLEDDKLSIETVITNLGNTESERMQIEHFQVFNPPEFRRRHRCFTAFFNGPDLNKLIPFEPWGQIFVSTASAANGLILHIDLDSDFWLEMRGSDNTDQLLTMINGNLLTHGFNSEKFQLQPGESFRHTVIIQLCPGEISSNYPSLPITDSSPETTESKQNSARTNKLVLSDYFHGNPVFKERWSHLCFQYDRIVPNEVKKVLKDILQPVGFNGVILEFNRGLRTGTHPELACDWSLTMKQARDLVDFAKDLGFQVGIQFNSPGHQNETGVDLAHPEFMEPLPDTAQGYTLCVSNPGARRLIQEVIQEMQYELEPDLINFGSDEVQFEGYDSTLGHCSRCKAKDPFRLFGEYMQWLFSLNLNPGKTVSAMWGDMFIQDQQFGEQVTGNGSAAEIWRALEYIPRDTQILDWHYYFSPDFRSLDFFRDHGYSPWAATAFEYKAIRQFLLYAEKRGFSKALHTTWAVPNPESLPIETMIWHGFYQWHGRNADNIKVKDIAKKFCRSFW